MNRLTKSFLFLLICIYSVNCDFIYKKLHKEGAEEMELVGELDLFNENENVKEIQTLLILYGYSAGKADGILGPKTRSAVERFQSDVGLEPSRFVDNATWAQLKSFKDKGFILDGELNVKYVQEILISKGFDPGGADGKFGPKTKQAVKLFQEQHGLKADGKVGYQTMTKLNELLTAVE